MAATIKRLQLTSNIDPAKAAAGDVGALVTFIPEQAGESKQYSVAAADLWKLGNVVYDSGHRDFAYINSFGSNTHTLADVLDATGSKYLKQFAFDFSANPSGYAGFYFGAASGSSAATTGLEFEFYSEVAGDVVFSATDAGLVDYNCTKTVVAGWQSISIPWVGAVGTGFSQTTFAHPADSFQIQPASTMPYGVISIDRVRYDSIVTMAGSSPTVLNGVQFAISPIDAGGSPYNLRLARIKINQTMVDGPVAYPTRYMGIPRWTYKWLGDGYGAWRGPSAVGYNWLAGWTESGIVNPDNGATLSVAMLQMMYDSQQAYVTQFPAKQIGPFVPRYGRPSWEALATGGYVAGVWTDSTYNKWYWPDTDDWYGYMMRALLSVAQHYFLTESAQAKTILDNWMAWLDVYIIADGSYWQPPSGYGNDGVPTYTYKPVYAYACIAQACIYKYWIDGDALALKWYRRMLDTIYATKRMTATGNCIGISRGAEGSGYTTATVDFTVNGGAVAPTATAVIAGGKVVRYTLDTQGSGITSISAEVTCWDISLGEYSGKNLSLVEQIISPMDICFNPSGTKAFIPDFVTGIIYQYALSTAWDISSGLPEQSFPTGSVAITSIAFSADGMELYVCNISSNTIYQYTTLAEHAWNIGWMQWTGKNLSDPSHWDGYAYNFKLGSDGTQLYVLNLATTICYQYTLSVAWDISSGIYSGKMLVTLGQGLAFRSDGLIMCAINTSTGEIRQFNLSIAWDISSGIYSGKMLSVAQQDTTPRGLAFNPSGTKVFFVGNQTKTIHQYGTKGATCTPYLNDLLVGAFDANHAGWELAEIFNTYALLVNGNRPGGTVHFPTTCTANDTTAFVGLIALYQRNTTNSRPSLLNADMIPLHEWDIDPYHNNTGIENPMNKDTHVRGALWTETLAPTLHAAIEYGRYSGSWTWANSLYALVLEFIGLPGGSAHLANTPRPSNGLSDAYTDMIGGEPLQANMRGNLDSATYVVNASKQIVIPAAAGGGNVTWVRGAWAMAVPFRWEGFMADIDPDYVGDTTNYATVSATNLFVAGVYSTVIQLAASASIGATLQVYYSYRDGSLSIKGEAMSGWPMLHRDPYQGTANDGDNYLMMELMHFWRVTGDIKYKNDAMRIGAALLDAGRWEGNEATFTLPLDEEEGQIGMYTYHGNNTPLSVYIESTPGLRVKATVLTGQSPANYAGFGLWPSWTIDGATPFYGIDFELKSYGNARRMAQTTHERFAGRVLELDPDSCTNTFGVAPCTATGVQCYNTYGTCKDKANYVKGAKTYKFCTRGMAIPPGETLRPYITAASFTPTEIPAGGGLAMRSHITFTLADETCADYEGDPYAASRAAPAGGTFWTRWLARNYNIVGRLARSLNGYVTQPWDWETFQSELYVIESVKGVASNNTVQVVVSDVIKPLDKNLLPKPTSGKLVADCAAVAFTHFLAGASSTTLVLHQDAEPLDEFYTGMEAYITQNTGAGQRRTITAYVGETRTATVSAWLVVPDTTSVVEVSALSIDVGSGNGAQYAAPVNGIFNSGIFNGGIFNIGNGGVNITREYICIGDEVIRYMQKSGDVLSWPSSEYRAQFGTTREDHSAGDGVQQCFTVYDKSAAGVIQKLCNASGVSDTYIDLTGLAQEDADWLGSAARMTACFPSPEKASGLLNELLRDLNLFAWWDAVGRKFVFLADMPPFTTSVKAITADEIVGNSAQLTQLDELRITQAFVHYAPYSATGSMTERQNFRYTDGYEDIGAESANEYNGVVQKQVFSRWLSEANQVHAHALVARRISRFRDAPFKLKFKLDPRDEVSVGELIDATTRQKTDASGAALTARMRVTKLLCDGNFDVEAVSTTFTGRGAFIAPAGAADYPADAMYAHISDAAGQMSDGSAGYTIL